VLAYFVRISALPDGSRISVVAEFGTELLHHEAPAGLRHRVRRELQAFKDRIEHDQRSQWVARAADGVSATV
jgi:hypothetical protein